MHIRTVFSGDSPNSQGYTQNKSLGKWVQNQRELYKYMRQGKSSSITEQRIQHLEYISFQWIIRDRTDDAWYKKYEELRQYKCREVHCNVPWQYSKNNWKVGEKSKSIV